MIPPSTPSSSPERHAARAEAVTHSTAHETDYDVEKRHQQQQQPQQQHSQPRDPLLDAILDLPVLPRIVVFDLDNTLWTPELYQIRRREPPRVNEDVRLFPDAVRVLEWWLSRRRQSQSHSLREDGAMMGQRQLPALGIASRTSKTAWAEHLLDAFAVGDGGGGAVPMRSLFEHVQIRTGSKTAHLARIRDESGAQLREMLFVDDDVRMNLGEVSRMGVLCCHTPRGITVEHLVRSLQRYSELNTSSGDNGDDESGSINSYPPWMGLVLDAKSLGIVEPDALEACAGDQERRGRVKFYSVPKKFGFLVDEATGHEFFVHESKVPEGLQLRTGDKVRFRAAADSSGRPSATVLGPCAPTSLSAAHHGAVNGASDGRRSSYETNRRTNSDNNASSKQRVPYASLSTDGAGAAKPSGLGSVNGAAAASNMVSMPCFSMSQPFAALLLNGFKTVESRNSPMLGDLEPGTRVLVHCGRRDWHDVESYKLLLPRLQEEDPSRLRPGFFRGSVVGVATVGRTWRPSPQERSGPDLARRVLAPERGIGTYCTEITSAAWLTRPHKVRGSPGVFSADVPRDCLPGSREG
jgi:magnesium-dependent phosphatase 1